MALTYEYGFSRTLISNNKLGDVNLNLTAEAAGFDAVHGRLNAFHIFLTSGSLLFDPRRMDPFLEGKVYQQFREVKFENPGEVELVLM